MLNDPFAKVGYDQWTRELGALSDPRRRSETALGMAFIAYVKCATAHVDNHQAAMMEQVTRAGLLSKVSEEQLNSIERGFFALFQAGELAVQMGEELRLQFHSRPLGKQVELVIREIPADDNPYFGLEALEEEEEDESD